VPDEIALHALPILVFSVVRVALTPKVNLGAVWEKGCELVDTVHRPFDVDNLSHFKLILTEI